MAPDPCRQGPEFKGMSIKSTSSPSRESRKKPPEEHSCDVRRLTTADRGCPVRANESSEGQS